MGNRIHRYTAKELAVYLAKKDAAQGEGIDFLKFGWDHVASLRKAGRNGSADNFRTMLNTLQDFFKRESLDISEITAGALRDLENFLRSERTITRKGRASKPVTTLRPPVTDTGVSNCMTYIRTLFNAAVDHFNDEDKGEIRIPHYPFRKYKVPAPAATAPRNVDVAVIRALRDHPDTFKRSDLARDVAMLSFYLVGINTVDLYNLEATSYENGRISYNRSKTRGKRQDKAFISIKVEPEAEPLIKKYQDPSRQRLFRFYRMYADSRSFNSAVNVGLKKILPEGLPAKKKSGYITRHSWASIARNDCGISREVVHDALNHTDQGMRITDIYIEKDWSHIDRANRKVLDYLKG